MKDLMQGFPKCFQEHNHFGELRDLVSSITNHEAMKVNEKHVVDNMIRASLAFTVCFYGNLRRLLEHALGITDKPRHPFAIETDGDLLFLILELAKEELTDVIPGREARGPHYLLMLDAAQQAGIETVKIEQAVEAAKGGRRFDLNDLYKEQDFVQPLQSYLRGSEFHADRFLNCFSTIALRELTLSGNFHEIVNHLPGEERLEGFRNFLTRHISLDEGSHSKLMSKALEKVCDEDWKIDWCIRTMIQFYTARRAVYDACLHNQPLFKSK